MFSADPVRRARSTTKRCELWSDEIRTVLAPYREIKGGYVKYRIPRDHFSYGSSIGMDDPRFADVFTFRSLLAEAGKRPFASIEYYDRVAPVPEEIDAGDSIAMVLPASEDENVPEVKSSAQIIPPVHTDGVLMTTVDNQRESFSSILNTLSGYNATMFREAASAIHKTNVVGKAGNVLGRAGPKIADALQLGGVPIVGNVLEIGAAPGSFVLEASKTAAVVDAIVSPVDPLSKPAEPVVGEVFTCDISRPANVLDVVTEMTEGPRPNGSPYDIVVGDVSVEGTSENVSTTYTWESSNNHLIGKEMYIALSVVKDRGTVMLKFFGLNAHLSQALILLMSFCSEIHYVKPHSSRATNEEGYVVFKDIRLDRIPWEALIRVVFKRSANGKNFDPKEAPGRGYEFVVNPALLPAGMFIQYVSTTMMMRQSYHLMIREHAYRIVDGIKKPGRLMVQSSRFEVVLDAFQNGRKTDWSTLATHYPPDVVSIMTPGKRRDIARRASSDGVDFSLTWARWWGKRPKEFFTLGLDHHQLADNARFYISRRKSNKTVRDQ